MKSAMIYQVTFLKDDISKSIFDEEPTIRQLVMLAVSFAFFWAVVFKLLTGIISYLIRDKPQWLLDAANRDYERGGRETAEAIGMDTSREACQHNFFRMWPWLQVVSVQHALGGLLCLPSLLNLSPHNPSVANSLACLGIISEMGWEIQDLITWIYKRYGTEHGKDVVQLPFLVIITMHHAMTTILAVPLIMNYRNLKTLHWICFELQFAAFVVLSFAEYTKLLDLSKPRQLQQFQILSLIALVVSIWSRVIHWLYLLGEFMVVWYQDQAYGFLVIGGVLGALFSLFSYAIVVRPQCKRWLKFRNQKVEYDQVLSDDQSTPDHLRSSFVALNSAAGELLLEMEEDGGLTELAERLFPSKATDEIDRRASVPASLRLYSERRRSSFLKLLQDPIDESSRRATLNGDSISSLVSEAMKKDQ